MGKAISTKLSFLILSAFAVANAYGHPGGLNAEGCHNNRATGEYHCHGKPLSPEDKAKIANENRSQSVSGYDRDSWSHWDDLDGDGRDTREQLLEESSLVPVVKHENKIVSGLWEGKLTGQRGTKPTKFHIDHIIPLAYASRAGGREWSPKKKQLFANDPENLIIATASANTSKSDRGPEEWMPRKKDYQCDYLKSWVSVADKYELRLRDETVRYIRSRGDCLLDYGRQH